MITGHKWYTKIKINIVLREWKRIRHWKEMKTREQKNKTIERDEDNGTKE